MQPREKESITRAVGLCTRCDHARSQRSARGSDFWRCKRADSEPRFLRYPPLPVRVCDGFEPTSDSSHGTRADGGDKETP